MVPWRGFGSYSVRLVLVLLGLSSLQPWCTGTPPFPKPGVGRRRGVVLCRRRWGKCGCRIGLALMCGGSPPSAPGLRSATRVGLKAASRQSLEEEAWRLKLATSSPGPTAPTRKRRTAMLGRRPRSVARCDSFRAWRVSQLSLIPCSTGELRIKRKIDEGECLSFYISQMLIYIHVFVIC